MIHEAVREHYKKIGAIGGKKSKRTWSDEQKKAFRETIKILEDRQGLKIACLEEIAYRMGYIDAGQVEELAAPLMKNGYGQYLMEMLNGENMR